MPGNRDLILAGINGGGAAGNSLAYFGPPNATAPTSATAAPAAAFLDAGWCTQDGLTLSSDESSTNIQAFGTFAPVRTIVTESTQTFGVTFLESNPVTLAVYHRKALGSLVPSATGGIDFATGAAESVRYSAVFDLVDGVNHLRAYCPTVEVTDREDLAITAGEAVTYGVTLTAFPDAGGNSIYWFYVLDALVTP
jgi:hypothetical protein